MQTELCELTGRLREIHESLLPQLERLRLLLEDNSAQAIRQKLEERYEELSELRQRLALCLDVLEGRAVVEERGMADGKCYLVVLVR